MNKVDEAAELLGDGLRANPDSYEILFELGRIYQGNYQNADRARQLWERALRKWREQETGKQKEKRNYFMLAQITSHLGFLEKDAENWRAAIDYMRQWQEAVTDPSTIQRRIELLQRELQKEGAEAVVKPTIQ
jgi:tetratricopeptide (TPR) repeat protein